MSKKVNVTKHYPRQVWFDKECQQAKTEVIHFEILEEVIQWKIELGILNSANSIENCSQENLTATKVK